MLKICLNHSSYYYYYFIRQLHSFEIFKLAYCLISQTHIEEKPHCSCPQIYTLLKIQLPWKTSDPFQHLGGSEI